MDKNSLILIVEDDKLDAKILLKGLAETEYCCSTHIARNGKEALDYLSDDSNKKPSLIFLDINMPVMNGIEFLSERNKNANLTRIPTIIFTTSNKKEDKDDCYNAGIAGYMIKPIEYSEFKDLLLVVKNYWNRSKLPELN